MDATTLILVFVVMVIGMFGYSFYQIQGKIYCSFRREDKTKIEKWVKADSHYVRFTPGKGNKKGQYNIDTKRITLLRWNRGIFQFFPILVPSLDFSWYSPNPHDPQDFNTTWDTPEVREAARQEGAFISFAQGVDSQLTKKSKLSDMLIPMITIAVVIAVGYLVYQQGAHLSYLEQLIRQGMPPVLP